MQQRTLYRSLEMKLKDVIQTDEEIDEAVHRAHQRTVEQGVVVSRTSSHKDRNVGLSVHDLQVDFRVDLKSVQIVCNSYEDPNVDDVKQNFNNRDDSEDGGGCSTSSVLN